MIDAIRRFFRTRILADAEDPSGERTEHALRLATAALLFEVSEADARADERQREAARHAICVTFQLSHEEATELLDLAKEEARRSVSLFEFTRLVDEGFTPAQKNEVLERLWLVAYSSGEMDPKEEQLIRRIADLIHVEHRDFIETKQRARTALLGSSSRD
jgi:uncharacterized tellurite resistance protein B-like protein